MRRNALSEKQNETAEDVGHGNDGRIDDQLAQEAHKWWADTARSAQIDLSGFDPAASLSDRIAWALGIGLVIGGILARQSTKMQHSISAQVFENVQYAARHRIYCADAITSKKMRRAGLDRMKELLDNKLISVLLVFKVSRLFRSAHRGYAFFQENVVELGLRAISVSQGIDTADKQTWKTLTVIHGLSDEMLLTAISDHVRAGLGNLFLQGFVTGALTIGYEGVEVPGARPTNQGKPRRMPKVCAIVALLIVKAFESIRDGMPIKQAWFNWINAGGPSDPRSRTGVISYHSFRRLLSNPRYTGRWAFGRTRNQWSSKKDYIEKVDVPETEVKFVESDELRIVSDELFFAVQKKLAEKKGGATGPKRTREPRLWDFVAEVFFCAHCNVRFYHYGFRGGMRCKNGERCPCKTTIVREEAVLAVCDALGILLNSDESIVREIIEAAQIEDGKGDEQAQQEIVDLEKRDSALCRKLDDLREVMGEGTDGDRAATKARYRTTQKDRVIVQEQLAQARRRLQVRTELVTLNTSGRFSRTSAGS